MMSYEIVKPDQSIEAAFKAINSIRGDDFRKSSRITIVLENSERLSDKFFDIYQEVSIFIREFIEGMNENNSSSLFPEEEVEYALYLVEKKKFNDKIHFKLIISQMPKNFYDDFINQEIKNLYPDLIGNC